jgi:hypothetical protein
LTKLHSLILILAKLLGLWCLRKWRSSGFDLPREDPIERFRNTLAEYYNAAPAGVYYRDISRLGQIVTGIVYESANVNWKEEGF